MSQINVNNLTFSYDTSYEPIFENVSFTLDTNWKLGFIGRNGRGKTTFLNLLLGKYKYSGTITYNVHFDYFPFDIENKNEITLNLIKEVIAPFKFWEARMNLLLNQNSDEALIEYSDIHEKYIASDGYIIDELIKKEISKLEVDTDVLNRQFCTLSNGEQMKLLLAALFLKKNNFLLIDEPTNHLDIEGRHCISSYLNSKSGFMLVSHDRQFIDNSVNHILSINKKNIEIQQGNYSTWKFNKDRQDKFEIDENNKLKKDITQMKEAFERTKKWSDKVEASKIGSHTYDRGFVGHKAAKMMKRAKAVETREFKAIEEKSKLLKNIEKESDLKLSPLKYFKNCLIEVKDLSINYDTHILFNNISFQVNIGDRVAINGKNGSGKTSILKLLLGCEIPYSGYYSISSNLIISYVSQDTSFLKGNLKEFCEASNIDESLFKAILRKMDFTRTQFEKDMSEFSSGQKKKVLIAKSLSTKAHLYIWDEPLNFIDILSRIQIENLILKYCPTLIFVEHDELFNKNIATKVIEL